MLSLFDLEMAAHLRHAQLVHEAEQEREEPTHDAVS